MPLFEFNKNIITSFNNPKIKELVMLRDSRYRRKKKFFIIEGRREVGLAFDSKISIVEIYTCADFFAISGDNGLSANFLKKGISVTEVSKTVYSKIAFGERREGIIAVARQPSFQLDNFKLSKNPLVVVLESVEKPGNLGAVMRVVDACGADGLIIADPLADFCNPNTVRASLGTLFKINLAQAKSEEVISWLRKNNIRIICAAVGAETKYTSVDFRKPSAIVFGSEQKGLSRVWIDNADITASLPMRGSADSLNVSCAVSVFAFEALRERGVADE